MNLARWASRVVLLVFTGGCHTELVRGGIELGRHQTLLVGIVDARVPAHARRGGVDHARDDLGRWQGGQAAAFERARWGEFRVAADGTALLTHLRDEKLQRLGAPRP